MLQRNRVSAIPYYDYPICECGVPIMQQDTVDVLFVKSDIICRKYKCSGCGKEYELTESEFPSIKYNIQL